MSSNVITGWTAGTNRSACPGCEKRDAEIARLAVRLAAAEAERDSLRGIAGRLARAIEDWKRRECDAVPHSGDCDVDGCSDLSLCTALSEAREKGLL